MAELAALCSVCSVARQTADDAACRDAAVQVAAQELLAQFPAPVLRAALRGDQWRDVMEAVADAGRAVEAEAPPTCQPSPAAAKPGLPLRSSFAAGL